VRPTLFALGFLALVAASPVGAQTGDPGDVDDFRTLTVLHVDPAANEIRVRETGTLRVRTLQLDENSMISGGGGTGGSMTLREIQAGDTIRVRDLASSASDRVHADRIQVLATPPDRAGPGGMRVDPTERPMRSPNALDPADEPGALGSPRPGDPSALDPQRQGDPSVLDPQRPGAPSALDPERPGAPSALDPERPGAPSALDPERPGDPSALSPDNGPGAGRNRGSTRGSGSGSGSGTGGSTGGSGGGGGP
jgi:hypothetical protein